MRHASREGRTAVKPKGAPFCWALYAECPPATTRHDRVTLDPAAWIRWRERVATGLENAGARIEDVSLGKLKGWFERHMSVEEAVRRALHD